MGSEELLLLSGNNIIMRRTQNARFEGLVNKGRDPTGHIRLQCNAEIDSSCTVLRRQVLGHYIGS